MLSSVLDHRFGIDTTRDRLAESLHAFGAGVQWTSPATGEPRGRRARLVGGDWHSPGLVVSPGSVQLTYRKPEGWERADDWRSSRAVVHELEHLKRQLDRLDVRLWMEPAWFGEWDYFAEREALLQRRAVVLAEAGAVRGRRGRGVVAGWSARSRVRMVRRLATLDWSRLRAREGWALAMVTLTYPGDWLTVAPDGATAKRQLDRFRKAWLRRFRDDAAVWKMEFQRRGAPHFHLLLLVRTDECGLPALADRQWARATWARIVGASGEERRRHELAGVSIDVGEGARCSDPQRAAVYFAKHNAPGRTSKEYQHTVPVEWAESDAGVGRWWGYWRLRPAEMSAGLDRWDAIDARRLLRGWVRSQRQALRFGSEVVLRGGRFDHGGGFAAGAGMPVLVPRTSRQRVQRVTLGAGRSIDKRTGEIFVGKVRHRTVTRRHTVRSLSATRPAGFVLTNDGPALAAAIARGVALLRDDGPERDWRQRGPLP